MNRKIIDNWLWDLYNTTKFKVKNGDTTTWSAHEMRVAEVFNKISTSETELPSDDIIDKMVDLSYKVDSQTTTTADFNNVGKVT